MKLPLPKSTSVITAPELAKIIGADMETINNWIRRGIISRMPIGGRQLKARLFSTDEVYKAALISELVRLGIQPSPASEVANAIWKEWDGKRTADGRKLYAVVVPSKGKWRVELCSQKESGKSLYQGDGSALFQMELPKQAFAVIPISDVFERVNSKMSRLFGG